MSGPGRLGVHGSVEAPEIMKTRDPIRETVTLVKLCGYATITSRVAGSLDAVVRISSANILISRNAMEGLGVFFEIPECPTIVVEAFDRLVER